MLGLGVDARAQLPWDCAAATHGPAPAAPGRGTLPLCGSTGLGTQQVLEETLELRVPGGLQAAGGPEGGVPEWPLGCSWGQPVSGHMPEAGLNVGSGHRPTEARLGPALTGTIGWREEGADVTITSQRPDPVVGLRVTRKGLGAQHLWGVGRGHEGPPLSDGQARGSGLPSEALSHRRLLCRTQSSQGRVRGRGGTQSDR